MFSTLNKRGPLLLGILTVDLFVFCSVNCIFRINGLGKCTGLNNDGHVEKFIHAAVAWIMMKSEAMSQ